MKIDRLMLVDLKANILRGFKLIRILNFDRKNKIGAVRAEISVSSACNYRCCFCHSHSYLKNSSINPEIMNGRVLHELLNDLRKLQVREILFSGNGEPLLCNELVNEIKQSGKDFKIEIITNGSCLNLVDEELLRNLEYLTISLNSGNGASHQQTHGYKGENKFFEILDNIKRISEYKHAKYKIKLNYAITNDNIDELDDFIKLAMDLGVLFMVRPISVDFPELKYKELDGIDLRHINNIANYYLKTQKLTNKIRLSLELLNRSCGLALDKLSPQPEKGQYLHPCYMPYIQPYISSNGDVLLCSSGEEKPLGNINIESFKSIWQKEATRKMRLSCTQMHVTNNPVFNECINCANVLYHSATFHGIYSRITILSKYLENNYG